MTDTPATPLRLSEPYDCVIVGAGLAGLCAGALLAQAGWRVLVCEKQPHAGGCCTSFFRNGYRFDLSVQSYSGCAPDGAVGSVLGRLGVADRVAFRRLDPAREYLFPDRTVRLPASLDEYREYLAGQFPRDRINLRRYFTLQQSLYEEVRRLPLDVEPAQSARFAEEFPHLAAYRGATLAEALIDHIADRRLRAILAIRASCFALPPSLVSFAAVCHLEMSCFEQGVYAARGGTQALSQALVAALRQHGGELALATEVVRVRHEQGKVVAVETAAGGSIGARRVVAASSPVSLFTRLLDPPLPARDPYRLRLQELRTSYSWFIGFWGLAADDLGGSPAENKELFDDYDLEREYKALGDGTINPHSPCLVLIPSLGDREAVPKGRGQTLCVGVKAPYEPAGGPWTTEQGAFLARRLFDRARKALPRLNPLDVEAAETITPVTIERLTGNFKGSPYGWAHIPNQAGIDRPGPGTPIQGLWLAGHWTRPGGGVASVFASATMLVEKLLQEDRP
jgi:prolycopene isomerase